MATVRTESFCGSPAALRGAAVIGLTVAFLLLTNLGCRRAAPPDDDGPAPVATRGPFPADHFVWTSAEPQSVDPALVSDLPGAFLALNLFEGLTVPGPGDEPPRLGVAERVTVSEDGRTVHVDLRDDVRWSDGTPVTAHDFVFAWLRALDPQTASPGAHDLWRLENGRAYHEGRIADPRAVGVRATGSLRLEIVLEHPDPLLWHTLATSRFLPVPQHVVAAHGDRWTAPAHIVTNGPFRLVAWRPREFIRLARNPDHRAAADVPLEGAVLRVTDSEALAARWFDRGEVDYTPGQVPFDRLVAAGTGDEAQPALRRDPFLGVGYLAFNLRRAPFDSVDVRRAFALAVDRAALIRAALRGGQAPAGTYLPERYQATIGYEGPEGFGRDPEAARDALAAAGFPGGQGFPEVVLAYNTSDVMERLMTVLAGQLREVLGVRVRLEHQEWMTYLSRVREGDFDLARFAMQGDVDPLALLEVFRSGGRNNIGGYGSPSFDALLEKVRREGDREVRLALLREAEALLIADVALLPLYFYTRPALMSPRVRGFAASSRGMHLLRYLAME